MPQCFPKTSRFAVVLVTATLMGCAPAPHSPCADVRYPESGPAREQFTPCAAEMVAQLDRAQSATEVMADQNQPEASRMKARQECLIATSDLARSLKLAGGSTKLMARWDDTKLNEFNWAVLSARDYFLSVCFYGPKPFERSGTPLTAEIDPNHEQARKILAEIR